MTYPKMKPCPKCGEAVAVYTYEPPSSSRRVECDGCGYIGSCEGSVLQAIRSHNERAETHTLDSIVVAFPGGGPKWLSR